MFWCFFFIWSTGVARMGPRGGLHPTGVARRPSGGLCSTGVARMGSQGGPPFDRGRRRPSGWPPFDRGRSDWPSGGPPYDRGRSEVLRGASFRQGSFGLAMGTSCSRGVTQHFSEALRASQTFPSVLRTCLQLPETPNGSQSLPGFPKAHGGSQSHPPPMRFRGLRRNNV